MFTSHGPDLYGTEPASFYLLNGLLNFNLAFLAALAVLPAHLLLRWILRKEAVPESRHPILLTQVMWKLVKSTGRNEQIRNLPGLQKILQSVRPRWVYKPVLPPMLFNRVLSVREYTYVIEALSTPCDFYIRNRQVLLLICIKGTVSQNLRRVLLYINRYRSPFQWLWNPHSQF